jgi:nucleotide-binding universal stress UspA family protein
MFKTVLAHLAGTDCDQSVLSTTLNLVRPFAGHMECVCVTPDPAALAVQAMQFDMGMSMVLADVMSTIEQQGQARTKRSRQAMLEFCKTEDIILADVPPGPGDVSAAWRESKAADEWDHIIGLARFHDVTVLGGGRERPGRSPAELLGSAVVSSGRPVVLAPEKPRHGPIRTIAVAWKDTAEAARALTAAMPLLVKAQRIEVLSANENDGEVAQCLDCSESVVQQLRWHGLNVNSHFIIPAGRSVADAVLESTHGLDADLLVMGGYGHSRLREFVFGGFTQRILQGVDLPVFLFH